LTVSLGAEAVTALDRALARAGTTVILRRASVADVECPASVRSPTAQELIGGYKQSDSIVVLSPTPLASFTLPIKAGTGGDRVVIDGKARQVEVYSPFVVGGVLARIELKVLG